MSYSKVITEEDLRNILNEVLPVDEVDYIVEQGSGNNWKYRKWESGRLEQWYEGYFMSYNISTARGSFYSGAWQTLSYPITFTASHTVSVCATISTDAYVILAQAKEFNLSNVKIRLVSSGSTTGNNYRVFAYAEGTWK